MPSPASASAAPDSLKDGPPLPPLVSTAIIAAVAAAILFLFPPPQGIDARGWRMFAIFFCTVLALMLRPIPGGAAVLIGVTSTILLGVLPITEALSGYGNTTVWLVISAFFIARALINSGLARRISLMFVRAIGHTSLGLGYSLVASDFILATIIPSNSARVGGVIFPITRTLAEIYKSTPGPTAALLGTYLMLTVYHGDIVACAMFLTGQAGNAIGVDLAQRTAGVQMTWAGWLWASLLPALVAGLAMPWIVYRLSPPEKRSTPEAAAMARAELEAMGPLKRDERVVMWIFILVCGVWITSPLHGIGTTTAALMGVCVLLASRALSWEDAMREKTAWDIFVWYGGLVRMGEALNDFGLTQVFASWVGQYLAGWEWPALMALVIPVYFYVHYAFASLTTHFISLYSPFMAVVLAAGAPAPLVAYSMAFYTNLSASLTHYGTTHSPIVFAAGYVTMGHWWRMGFLVSVINLVIWSTVGLAWWKVIGLW